jgi:predicted RNA binding protein YcfA (HicA-like mRNA interferase family)
MGRLSGFSYQKVTKNLRKLGFEFYRSAKGDHEIWFNSQTLCKTTIPHHKQIKEGTQGRSRWEIAIAVGERIACSAIAALVGCGLRQRNAPNQPITVLNN